MKVEILLAPDVFKVCEYVIIASSCSHISHGSLFKEVVCKAERTIWEAALGRGALHCETRVKN